MGTGSAASEVSAECLEQQEKRILKQQYRACWATLANARGSLRKLIHRLVELQTSREELLEWAVEAGASLKHAQKLISEAFRALGRRQRQPGGGRRSDPLSLEVMYSVCGQYGLERARSILHGAARAADAKVRRLARQQLQSPSLIPDGNKPASQSSPLIPDGNKDLGAADSVIPDGNKDLMNLPPIHPEKNLPSENQL